MPFYFKNKFARVIVSVLIYCIRLVAHSALILSRLMDRAIKYMFDHRSESHFKISFLERRIITTLIRDSYTWPKIYIVYRLIVKETHDDDNDSNGYRGKMKGDATKIPASFYLALSAVSVHFARVFLSKEYGTDAYLWKRTRVTRKSSSFCAAKGEELMLLCKTKK